MTANNPGNLALLIDGDNVSSKIIGGLMAEIASYGTASVRRIYGDFTNTNLRGWKDCLLAHSIIPIQQFAYTTGKNATDGAMIIDAMDLLYTGRFSSFCLVSSDSDFTRLAARIREQGVKVYGFGERKTNNAFVAACDKFVYFDVLNLSVGEPEQNTRAIISPGPLLLNTSPPAPKPTNPSKPSTRPLDNTALNGLATAITNSTPYAQDDYVNLADVGLQMSKISPDLNARNYGYNKLWEFVEASGIAEMKRKDMGQHPSIALVRLKKRRLE
ncbi:hypothetical protein N0V82_005702 [Gnomoniopsis sp. IMI 355080]|nr:hypothetical protein N0V82_005702 [Gnomoniopsis sp. IMI 355080]